MTLTSTAGASIEVAPDEVEAAEATREGCSVILRSGRVVEVRQSRAQVLAAAIVGRSPDAPRALVER